MVKKSSPSGGDFVMMGCSAYRGCRCKTTNNSSVVIAVGVGHCINGGIIINRTIIRTEHVITYFTAFSGFANFIGTILVGITKVKTEIATVGVINNRVDLCLTIDKNEKLSRTAFLQTRYFGKFCSFIVVGFQIITIRITIKLLPIPSCNVCNVV